MGPLSKAGNVASLLPCSRQWGALRPWKGASQPPKVVLWEIHSCGIGPLE